MKDITISVKCGQHTLDFTVQAESKEEALKKVEKYFVNCLYEVK